MSAGFTPGPWEASLEAARFVIQHTPDHGMGKRALAVTGGAEPANPYNAHLIAAAPDLYEAVSEAILRCSMSESMRKQLHAALAKARGEA